MRRELLRIGVVATCRRPAPPAACPRRAPRTMICAAALDLPHHQRIDIDAAPGGEVGLGRDVADALRQARRIERREEARAAEVGADDLGDLGAEGRIGRGEIGDGDRQRHEIAAGDDDLDERRGGTRRRHSAAPARPSLSALRRVIKVMVFSVSRSGRLGAALEKFSWVEQRPDVLPGGDRIGAALLHGALRRAGKGAADRAVGSARQCPAGPERCRRHRC